MESNNSKGRTPSRCREWERKRRNKFNDAITRLGEVVKEINKAIDTTSKEADNIQYPKIEIVEKAILCLTKFAHEKTQLKAEILALQVKIETCNKNRPDHKDASTQVFIGINNKKQRKSTIERKRGLSSSGPIQDKDDDEIFQNIIAQAYGKHVKILMLQKSKRKALKINPNLAANVTVKSKVSKDSGKDVSPNKPSQNLPMLLPKTNIPDKKGSENNTIVVLPATPYIFPQRPLLFPTVPPAFVLVDSNLQTVNKPSFSLVNRNNGDITRTTMVNILPISAYSRPLSAKKSRKTNYKPKIDISNKKVKIPKQTTKVVKGSIVNNDTSKEKDLVTESSKENKTNISTNKEDLQTNEQTKSVETSGDKSSIEKNTNKTNEAIDTIKNSIKDGDKNSKLNMKESEISKVTNLQKCVDTVLVPKANSLPISQATIQKVNDNVENTDKSSKPPVEKLDTTHDKAENKLTNILDTTLCENTVDGGNARLELAEEFLAASPTAAFLMSFPLVSGNRADSPAEESQNTIQVTSKDNPKRNYVTTQSIPYFEKPSENKTKSSSKSHNPTNIISRQNDQHKYIDNMVNKHVQTKPSNMTTTNVSSENPFLNLTMSSLIPTSCTTLNDSTYVGDYDCNINKPTQPQTASCVSSSNIFYKSDPFNTVKSAIYSTSSISSGHEFNSFGLYPCAMEKFTTKNKSDYSNVEDNLMKIGSSRLTYDIDLGWSHKGFDFVNCTSATSTFNKDNILTTAAGPYSTSYNPFNPEFHVPLSSNSTKKDNSTSKSNPNASFAETLTSFYSQPTNLWSEDVPFYTNNNVSKTMASKNQNYLNLDHMQTNVKPNISKQYETKHIPTTIVDVVKPSNIVAGQQINDKYTKKCPSKMHINWMTSEIRPMQNNCNTSQTELKEAPKTTYGQPNHSSRKQDHNGSNYFPISMHNFPPQTVQEELQVWPSARPAGTTEISIEPPPINLPTLVGDLALGPHDKKKSIDISNRGVAQNDIQNCSNFFSVTHLMNRSTDNIMPSRYQAQNIEVSKLIPIKQNTTQPTNDVNRKAIPHLENHPLPQPCYVFNDSKTANSYEAMGQFSQTKSKANKSDKSSKVQKNSYSAEALIRGGTCSQKFHENNNTKFMPPSQKYNDFNVSQDNSVAQVSHFPPILDYSDNSYAGQQYSGTTLYNSTTNTMSNSFYSNFMPGSSNLMSGNYTSGPFSGEFIDYNQTTECNYPNHKFEELKIRNNPTIFHQEKVPSNYKSSRRESTAKHKLECSKKDSSKKYQNKRAKLNTETEEWNDTSQLLWQNKTPTKRHTSLISEELPFSNYVGNQMPAQYQPEFFNSHLMSSNMQTVGHNVDRSLTSFPVTSRANFNLSTIFPEITMKVQ